MIKRILICSLLFSVNLHAQNLSISNIQDFIKTEKFGSTTSLSEPYLNLIVEKELNRLATTFEFIASGKNAKNKYYHYAMIKFIQSLEVYEKDLSITDKTNIAQSVEKLMDFVGLQSSDGILNQFVYGFDPTSTKKSTSK